MFERRTTFDPSFCCSFSFIHHRKKDCDLDQPTPTFTHTRLLRFIRSPFCSFIRVRSKWAWRRRRRNRVMRTQIKAAIKSWKWSPSSPEAEIAATAAPSENEELNYGNKWVSVSQGIHEPTPNILSCGLGDRTRELVDDKIMRHLICISELNSYRALQSVWSLCGRTWLVVKQLLTTALPSMCQSQMGGGRDWTEVDDQKLEFSLVSQMNP